MGAYANSKSESGIGGRRCTDTGRKRMGGRVVEGTGLENRQGRKSFVGSNPTPSAKFMFLEVQ